MGSFDGANFEVSFCAAVLDKSLFREALTDVMTDDETKKRLEFVMHC